MKRIIPSGDITTIGGKTVIRERLRVDNDDYMKSLTWVRERKDGSLIFVTLFNPLNIGNVDIPGEDNNEAAIPVTFTGFNDNFADLANAPYEIVIWQPDAASAAGASMLSEMSVAELRAYAAEKGIDIPHNITRKETIIERIEQGAQPHYGMED